MTLEVVPFEAAGRWRAGVERVLVEALSYSPAEAATHLGRQSTYPDFIGRAALGDGALVGMGFGVRSLPGQWWHDRVAGLLGAGHPALRDAWCLVELGVLTPWRGLGLGGRLHDDLLAAQPCPRTLLSVLAGNEPALALYRGRGWRQLLGPVTFVPGGPRALVMAREAGA